MRLPLTLTKIADSAEMLEETSVSRAAPMECLYCGAPLTVEAGRRGRGFCGDEHEQLKTLADRLGIGSTAGGPGPLVVSAARPRHLATAGVPPGPAVRPRGDSRPTPREGLARLDSAVSGTLAPSAGSAKKTASAQKNVCQVCARPLPLLLRLGGAEYCSARHKAEAERRRTEQLLARVRLDGADLGGAPRFHESGRGVSFRPPASDANQPDAAPERSVESSGTVGAGDAWRFSEGPIAIPLPRCATGPAFGDSAESRGLAPREPVLLKPGIPCAADGGVWTSRGTPPSIPHLLPGRLFPPVLARREKASDACAPAVPGASPRARQGFLEEPNPAPRIPGLAGSPAPRAFSAALPARGRPFAVSRPSPWRTTPRIASLHDLTFHGGALPAVITPAYLHFVRPENAKTLSPAGRPADRIGLPPACPRQSAEAAAGSRPAPSWSWNSGPLPRAESVLQALEPSRNAVRAKVRRTGADPAVRIPDPLRPIPIGPAPEIWWWAHRSEGLSAWTYRRIGGGSSVTVGLRQRPPRTLAIGSGWQLRLPPVQSSPARLRIPAVRISY
jgi:hypothetical protein